MTVYPEETPEIREARRIMAAYQREVSDRKLAAQKAAKADAIAQFQRQFVGKRFKVDIDARLDWDTDYRISVTFTATLVSAPEGIDGPLTWDNGVITEGEVDMYPRDE